MEDFRATKFLKELGELKNFDVEKARGCAVCLSQ